MSTKKEINKIITEETPNEIGIIVRELRGDRSLRDFAKLCDVAHTTIDNIEKGIDVRTNKPVQVKLATLKKIANACNVPLSYITGYTKDKTLNLQLFAQDLNILPIKQKKLPLLGEIACGSPKFADQEFDTYIASDEDIQADFCLRAKGDSMINARIFDGDILFVKQQDIVEDGEIAVVIIEDEATVKRFYYDRENNIVTLVPENPKFKPIKYSGAELDQIHVLGKVIAGQFNVK